MIRAAVASQMTEDMDTQVAGHRKDSLDEATLSMLITEVESDNTKAKDHSRPGGPNHEDRFLQTQIIFGAPSSSQVWPLLHLLGCRFLDESHWFASDSKSKSIAFY